MSFLANKTKIMDEKIKLKTKIIIALFLTFFLTSSCVTNYYYVSLEEDTPIYENRNEGTTSYYFVPKGEKVYIATSKKKYKKIKWNKYKGWAINPVYNTSKTSSYSNSQTYTPSQNNYSKPSSTGGTVQVKGYYRKDGTYVRPHTRSAPKRK
jgi:hypothetical protein